MASVTEWLHMTMASGAEVITRFIIEKDATPHATATTKRGCLAISDSGRPSPATERGGGLGMFTSISTLAEIRASTDWPI